MQKPEVKKDINLEKVLEACKDYIDFLDSEEYHEDSLEDFENYIFEASLKAGYGDDVFDWVNSKIV